MKKIVIIGAGAMGSAFSVPCEENSHEVFLVGSFLEDKLIENINKFAKEKETQIVRLEQNYRSTANILNAANAVIGQNSNRLGKKLWTKGNDGDKIEVFEAYNEQEEANYISENAHAIFDAGDHYKDMAVLYRSNAQSRTIEEALLRQNIPYVIYGGVRFYERLEIKNVLSSIKQLI